MGRRSPLEGGPADGVAAFLVSGATAGMPLLLSVSRLVPESGDRGKYTFRQHPVEIGLCVVGEPSSITGLAPTHPTRDMLLHLPAAPAESFVVLVHIASQCLNSPRLLVYRSAE